jgi:hypothetical protein
MFNTTRSLCLMVCLTFAITASSGAYAAKTLLELKDPAGTSWQLQQKNDVLLLRKDGKKVCKEKIYLYPKFEACVKKQAGGAVLDEILKAAKKVL